MAEGQTQRMARIDRRQLVIPAQLGSLNVNSKPVNYSPTIRKRNLRSRDAWQETSANQRENLVICAAAYASARGSPEEAP